MQKWTIRHSLTYHTHGSTNTAKGVQWEAQRPGFHTSSQTAIQIFTVFSRIRWFLVFRFRKLLRAVTRVCRCNTEPRVPSRLPSTHHIHSAAVSMSSFIWNFTIALWGCIIVFQGLSFSCLFVLWVWGIRGVRWVRAGKQELSLRRTIKLRSSLRALLPCGSACSSPFQSCNCLLCQFNYLTSELAYFFFLRR